MSGVKSRQFINCCVPSNIIDPDIIILGGGLSNIERLYENIPRKWAGYVFSNKINTKLLKPKYGDSSGVRGAALLFGTN